MTQNLGIILSLLVAFQLAFTAIFLFSHRKGNKRNNRLLASVFALFAINLLDFISRATGYVFPNPLLHLVDECLFFLYGPILYFYTQGVVYQDFRLRRQHLFHGLPFFLVIAYLLIHLIFIEDPMDSTANEKITSVDFPPWMSLVGLFMYLHILIYLLFSNRVIKIYENVIKEKYSSIEAINLDWLKFMIRTFILIIVVAMISNLMPVIGNADYLYLAILFLLVISFYFINKVLIKALNQPKLFSGIHQKETIKYAQSGVSLPEIESYKSQLNSLMLTKRPYLNENLKSKDLAEELGVSSRVLSQIINQGFSQSFYDYVNTYRCEEVKRILKNNDKKTTIIEAMYQSGFNSKSSFNKEFKKLTGFTPSEYKKKVSKDL